MAAMAAPGVRSGSVAFARPIGNPGKMRLERTDANGRERSPVFAMRKVVGSSPIIRSSKALEIRGFRRVRPAWAAAWGCESPVEEMTPTTSQRQLRHREVGWEGSPRRIRDPRYTNRVQGGAVWTSRHDTAKPVVIKGPLRRRGGCAGKVAALIRGGLHGCPVWDGGGREAAARRGEVSRGRSTGGGSAGCREGPNAEPRRRSFVLAGVALIAANPVRGLGGKAEG
jgi:hypothetical protein